MRICLVAALSLVAPAAPGAPPWAGGLAADPIDAPALTSTVAAAVTDRHPGVAVEILAPLELELRIAGAEPARLYLDNLFRALAPDAAGRVAQVEHFVEVALSASALPALGPADAARVRPVIRHERFVLQSDVADGGRPGLVADPWVADLYLLYVVDLGDRIAYLNRNQLDALGVARADLRALAIGNLARQMDAVRVIGEGPAWMLVLDGTYESSLLLLDAVWDLLESRLGGEVAIAVPSRDAVFFAAASDTAALAQLRHAAARVAAESGYAITDRVFVRRAGGWVRLP